ncbi:MAG: MarR family transcriptional regulator [Clostridia bacterium]|nr:MarR family transcriptional regulator [Clostridia bacterium]
MSKNIFNECIGTKFYNANKITSALYKEYLNKYDLTYPQYLILRSLFEDKEKESRALQDEVLMDKATLSEVFKRLEDKELITRKRLVKDERQSLVMITDKGYKLKAKLKNIDENVLKSLKLNKTEMEKLNDLLDKINL